MSQKSRILEFVQIQNIDRVFVVPCCEDKCV